VEDEVGKTRVVEAERREEESEKRKNKGRKRSEVREKSQERKRYICCQEKREKRCTSS